MTNTSLSPKFRSYLNSFIESKNFQASDVIILKGIPNEYIYEIQTAELVAGKHFVNPDFSFNKDEILAAKSELMQTLMQVSSTPLYMSYECFLLLSYEIRPSMFANRNFQVIANNFLDFYPNTSGQTLNDIEKEIEQGNMFEENDLFEGNTQLYLNSKSINNEIYVQYADLPDAKNIHIHKLFENQEWKLSDLPKIEIGQIEDESFIYRSSEDKSFRRLEDLLCKDLDHFTIYVDNVIQGISSDEKRIGRLVDLLTKLDIPYALMCIEYDLSISTRPELNELLIKNWGENASFRTLTVYKNPDIDNETVDISQAEVIEYIITQFEEGQKKDTAVVSDLFLTAPTGAGKSLLFQLPAMYMAEKHNALTIIISPLIALMQDQVENLIEERKYNEAAFINSNLNMQQRQDILDKVHNGEISILYISPELFLSYDIGYFLGEDKPRKLGLVVIDEAHLVTTWGRDFRVDYWYLGYKIQKIRKYARNIDGTKMKFPVMAVTATAPYNGPHDIVFETISSLQLNNAKKYIGKVVREDIDFEITVTDIDRDHEERKNALSAQRILEFQDNDEKTIIYCPWTRHLNVLQTLVSSHGANRRPLIYHGQLDRDIREGAYLDFRNNTNKTMIATKAFGMGVDISDITNIYHHAPSGNLSDYIQEVGRAARDKDIQGKARIDYCEKDLKFIRILFGLSSLQHRHLREVLLTVYDRFVRNGRRRNMLMSIDDFSHIFPNDDSNIENKVKSALMLLEKGLEQQFDGIKVLIARPKSLFTQVYARILEKEFLAFQHLYGAYFTEIYYQPLKDKNMRLISLNLDELWKDKFRESGFPSFKREFYNERVFTQFDVKPKVCLSTELDQSKEETIEAIEQIFMAIQIALTGLTGGFFSRDQFAERMRNAMPDRTPRQMDRISDFILSIFSTKPLPINSNLTARNADVQNDKLFLQARRKENDEVHYRLIDRAFDQVKSYTVRMLSTKRIQDNKIVDYISQGSARFRLQVRLVQLIEIFNLGSFEMRGGERPMIYIRINDPGKVRRISSNDFYRNAILEDIRTRQRLSVDLMNTFFTARINSKRRWDVIEKYFLGYENDRLLTILNSNYEDTLF